MVIEWKFALLVFGVAFLIVLLTRRAIKKAYKDQKLAPVSSKKRVPEPKAVLSEEQFKKSWNSLSYLLLVAAAGSLYMVYTAFRSALDPNMSAVAIVFWVDAGVSLAAAIAAVLIWLKKTKTMVIAYLFFTLLPVLMFMSIKGTTYKISALIHLFPLVLLYFVLKPVWGNLKE